METVMTRITDRPAAIATFELEKGLELILLVGHGYNSHSRKVVLLPRKISTSMMRCNMMLCGAAAQPQGGASTAHALYGERGSDRMQLAMAQAKTTSIEKSPP
jgi:hypothetical protein